MVHWGNYWQETNDSFLLQHVDQHLGRTQIGADRFFDQLSDDRLLLGDLARSPSMVATTLSLSASTSGAITLFGRGPRGLPDWPFLQRLCTGGLPRSTS